jgi:hypothetical protein
MPAKHEGGPERKPAQDFLCMVKDDTGGNRMKHTIPVLLLVMNTAIFAAPEKGKPEKLKKPEEKTTVTGKRPEEMVKLFFEIFRSRGPAQAVDYIFSNNPYIYERQESVGALKEKIEKLEEVLGKEHGEILIQDRQFAGTLRVISYLIKYDRQPLRFTFIFYRASNRWVTYQFNFDDPVDEATIKETRSLNFEPVIQ